MYIKLRQPKVIVEHKTSTLSDDVKLSLYKKSQKSGIGCNILEEVFLRGVSAWSRDMEGTASQHAFGRVNSFLAGGLAAVLDRDLIEEYTGSEKVSKDPNNPMSRFDATNQVVKVYSNATPGQPVPEKAKGKAVSIIKKTLGSKKS